MSLLFLPDDILSIVLHFLSFNDIDSVLSLKHSLQRKSKHIITTKLKALKRKTYKIFKDESEIFKFIIRDPFHIRFIDNPSEKLCKLAVQQDGNAIKYIPKRQRNEEVCKLALQRNGDVIHYIHEHQRSEDVCKLAVQQHPYLIRYIHNPSEEVCKLAIQIDPFAIQYIHNPSEEVCKLAFQRNPGVIRYINI
jgi:hypothetical protein